MKKQCLLLAIILLTITKAAFAQAPTITSFSPAFGSIGTLVTIIGTNLNNLDTIKIGGVSAIKISAKTDTLVAMVMPGATTGNIYLTNSSGNVTSGSNFTKIASIPPAMQQGNKLVGTGTIAAPNVYQGTSVCVSADGNTAIVGGSADSSNRGAAWIFVRVGGIWSQQGNKLVGTGAIGNSQQGVSVSLSSDGNTAIVGGNFDNNWRGAAWVYTRSSGGVWSQQGNKLVGTGSVGTSIFQGSSVSISADGNTAMVGGVGDNSDIGATWIYSRVGGVWSQQGSKLVGTGAIGSSRQGISISLSADGKTAMVGGYTDNNLIGAAWVFTRNGVTWSQQGTKIIGSGASGNAYQGTSVSISADGNTAIVGGFQDNSGAGAAWIYNRSGSTWSQQGGKLVGTGASGNASQGQSVSLSADGNIAIVGGYQDNSGIGATWLFSRNVNTWSQQGSKLVGTGAIGNLAYQGTSVSLSSDGNTALVGGYGDFSYKGAIWVYVSPPPPTITSFTPASGSIGTLVTIIGTNLNNIDTLKIGGVSAIKISATSTNLVAMVMPGAITGNIYLTNSGGNVTSGSIFTKIASVPPAAQQGNKLVGTGNIGTTYQGEAVSISADGNTAIVGGRGDSSGKGAAWVYTRSGGFWSQQGSKLVGSGAIGYSNQGRSVSLSANGNTAIIGGNVDSSGKGAAWIFTRSGNIWTQQGNKLVGAGAIGNSNQGSSVSLSADGNTAVIGGDKDSNQIGAAWVFTRNGSTWTQQGNKLVGTGNVGAAWQGVSVSLSADGNTAIVGGIGDYALLGASWIFTRSGNTWTQQGNKLVGTGSYLGWAGRVFQGSSVSLSADGNTALIGGSADSMDVGAAWIFTRNGITWTQQGNKLVKTGSGFQGGSVSLSADGNTALVGSNDNTNQGEAWVYTRSAGIWSQQGSKRVGTGNIGTDYAGCAVTLSADGNTAIIGGYRDSSDKGAVWVFTKSSNTNLSNIIINNSILSPSFNKDSLSYFTTLSNSITNFTITPFRADSFSNIQIKLNSGNYVAINSGTASSALLLNVGINTVNIKVTAQDGTTIKIYTITINSLPSTNAKLSNINLIGTPYLPIFHSDTLAYSANVLFGVNNAKVSSILSDTSARIKIKMNSSVFTNINNKDTSALLPLNVGVNTIAIKVTAQDTAVTRTYLINITRAAAVAPSAMSYTSPTIIATRTITNINNSVTYSGDSITGFSISPALPTGVSLNNLTGRISGIPTVVFPQTVFTITGINSSGSTTANFTLTVNRIAPSNLKYTDSIVIATRTISNVNSPVTYSGDSIASFSIAPSLPNGVSLNTTTGLISGTPTVTMPQTIYTITGTNNGGNTTASFRLTVNRIAPTNLRYTDSIVIATRTITNINSSVTYSGDSIASFSISPSLPTGVSLNTTTGLISGTPTVTMPQTIYTITGTNNGGSTTASFRLTVNRIAPTNLKYTDSIVIATRTITNINSSVTYSGDSIASFSITPALPNGVSLNITTGLISGISMVNLPLTIFTITGSNSAGNTTASFTLTVNPALAIQEVNNTFSNINCKPNPFNNIIEISFESNTKETTKLIIMDAVGKEVFAKNIQSIIGENTITIDELTYLKSGIYFARLANNNGLSKAFKLVKE